MTPATLLRDATADGVVLRMSDGTLKASGEHAALNRWLPIIREHKAAILELLEPRRCEAAKLPRRHCHDCGNLRAGSARPPSDRSAKATAGIPCRGAARHSRREHRDPRARLGPRTWQPETRTGKSGKPFTTAKLRIDTGEEQSTWASVIAFANEAERLARLGDGDAVSLSGTAKLQAYIAKSGEPKASLSITVDEVAAIRRKPNGGRQ